MVDLKSEREKKNMTQDDLANMCGVVRQTISAYEIGQNRITVDMAKKIGNILDIPWSNFFEE